MANKNNSRRPKSRFLTLRLRVIVNLTILETTSKFHREFMSPALFLFEVLKMGKLTGGPLVLYHLPKY